MPEDSLTSVDDTRIAVVNADAESWPRTVDRRRFLRGAAAATVGGTFWLSAACFGDDDAKPAPAGATAIPPRRGGVLRMGQPADLNLAAGHPFALVTQNRILAYAASETLVQYLGSLDPQPLLAERFEVSPDFRRAVVTLKPGVQFHNGAPVTSDDVAFSVQTVQDPASAGLPAAVQFELSAFARAISDIKVADARTVEFTFSQPRTNLADFFAQLHIAHRATFKDIPQGTVAGTGPFMLKQWDKGRGYRLERFPDWHGAGSDGRPYLDAIEVSLFPDQTAAVIAFRGGTLDAYLAVGAPNAGPLRASGQTRIAPKTGMNYLGVNVSNPLLSDPRVRQAIFYAIDRGRMMRDVGWDFGTVTTQPWAAISPAFDPAREAPIYDPKRATDLLALAGFQQNRDLTIEYTAGISLQELQAQLIQSDLHAVGIATRLQAVEGGNYTVRYRTRQFPDFWLAGHVSGDVTPLTLFQQTFEFRPTLNASSFEDARYSELVKRLEDVPPRSPEAVGIYKQLNQIMVENPFVIPTGIPQVRIDLVQDNVAGWPTKPEEYAIAVTGKVGFADVWLS